MPWREALAGEPMLRVAIVTPDWSLRGVLVAVADSGAVELEATTDRADLPADAATVALRRLAPDGAVPPRLSPTAPDVASLEADGQVALLAGEAQLEHRLHQAIHRGEVAAFVGWMPQRRFPELSRRLAGYGAAVVRLPVPRGVEPPTAPRPGAVRETFAPLVSTYATPPYADVDPTILAGMSYAVMFGAMFGDAGHGLLLLLAALALRLGWPRPVAALRPRWLLVAAAGGCATAFGLAYGEFFGPTGLVPTLWVEPVEQPVHLLVAGVGLGAVLLAGAYAVGIVNRIREAGLVAALFLASGVAGALLFLAAGVAAAAWFTGTGWLAVAAVVTATVGLVLAYLGLLAAAGRGVAGMVQAAVELLDVVVRLGANVASFARLGAFGLTHAVLGWIVWDLTTAAAGRGAAGIAVAVLVFVVGNAVAFGLEALVAAVQALRLEYYELFSRVFGGEGRPFRPWHVPTAGPAEFPAELPTETPDGSGAPGATAAGRPPPRLMEHDDAATARQ